MDSKQSPVELRELALFAGIGGSILGGDLLGWRTIEAVEIDPFCRDILVARQNDGTLHPFPIWNDVRTYDGSRLRDRVDVISCGFPCQDISSMGKKKGITGERSGLWLQAARIIREVRPRFVLVENTPNLTSLGLGHVLGDLASMRYDAEWRVIGAGDCGAPHQRDRIWILGLAKGRDPMADPFSERRRRRDSGREDAMDVNSCSQDRMQKPELVSREQSSDSDRLGLQSGSGSDSTEEGSRSEHRDDPERLCLGSGWAVESGVGRLADGVPCRVDRLRGLGNAQVPTVAAAAFLTLNSQFLIEQTH